MTSEPLDEQAMRKPNISNPGSSRPGPRPLLLALVAALAVAACDTGDGAEVADASSSNEPLTPTPTATNDPDAYQGADRDETGATKPPNPNTVVSADPRGCDGPGETFSSTHGRCYRIVAEPTLTWSQAAIDCSLWSAGRGHLAAMTSATEDEFLSTLVTSTSWLGASDAKSEDQWVWLSGETWLYQNFQSGQPQNAEGVEHCLAKQAPPGQWDDVSCGTKLGYVCERALQK